MKNLQKTPKLLPNYYKKIGLAIIGIFIVIIVLSSNNVINVEKDLLKYITDSILLIAFLLIALSKDKIEDELTIVIRLRAFTATFIFGVMITIIDPYVNLLFEGIFYSERTATELLSGMFIYYFIMLFIMKKSR